MVFHKSVIKCNALLYKNLLKVKSICGPNPKSNFHYLHSQYNKYLHLKQRYSDTIHFPQYVSHFSLTIILSKTSNIISHTHRPRQPQTVKTNISDSNQVVEPVNEELQFLEDEQYETFIRRTTGNLFGYSLIAVIQPWIKWGKDKKRYTTPLLLLDEACALVKSLPSMNIVYKEYVTLQKISKSFIFGSGTLERLACEVRSARAQAVFISIDNLSRVQRRNLEENFRMRVFDRYTVVLAIFKHYASSSAAKLQIAIAELPSMSKYILNEKDKLILHQRESQLNTALKKLSGQRTDIRKYRQKASVPSVAIIGYTNCGKTTLIRTLTNDPRAKGENRLFATMDVTAHKGDLPCGLKVLFLDSVGFIQDIPTGLVASFQATLQDAINADVIIHVRDISHPDIIAQNMSVNDTLSSLSLPEDTPVILVNNKADLLEEKLQSGSEDIKKDGPIYKNGLYISAFSGAGVHRLLEKIQSEVLRVTGRKLYSMTLPTGSLKIDWLKNNVGVASEKLLKENPNNTRLITVMNEAEKAAYERSFKS